MRDCIGRKYGDPRLRGAGRQGSYDRRKCERQNA